MSITQIHNRTQVQSYVLKEPNYKHRIISHQTPIQLGCVMDYTAQIPPGLKGTETVKQGNPQSFLTDIPRKPNNPQIRKKKTQTQDKMSCSYQHSSDMIWTTHAQAATELKSQYCSKQPVNPLSILTAFWPHQHAHASL